MAVAVSGSSPHEGTQHEAGGLATNEDFKWLPEGQARKEKSRYGFPGFKGHSAAPLLSFSSCSEAELPEKKRHEALTTDRQRKMVDSPTAS